MTEAFKLPPYIDVPAYFGPDRRHNITLVETDQRGQHEIDYDDPRYKIRPEVREEVRTLAAKGYDVQIVDVDDPQSVSDNERAMMDRVADAFVEAPDGHERFHTLPAMRHWSPMRKRALALHALYGAAHLQTLGEGVDPAVYHHPLFPTGNYSGSGSPELISAYQLLQNRNGIDAADQELQEYVNFIQTPIDPASRAVYQASRDGESIRNRLTTGSNLISDHVVDYPYGTELVSASIACGAAGPLLKFLAGLEQQGFNIRRAHAIDIDPMALASAYSLAASAGMQDRIIVERRDITRGELTDSLGSQEIDLADALGTTEYFPNITFKSGRNPVVDILKRIKATMKPGGLILFGNMLDYRDQQSFFRNVVDWPPLYQRSITENLGIVAAAGLSPERTKVRIPARDGIYAAYATTV